MNAFSGGLSRLALAGMIAAGLMSTAQAEDKTIHIGYQKYGTLILLKAQGLLEEKLGPQGYTIEWTQFPAGPQLLEALNVGAIDFGTTGEAPPIFAQAAGAPLVYVGVEPAAPKAEAILVPKDSPLQSVADLKGKTVGLNKGSNVHYLLVKALESAGLSYSDIEVAFLPPADGRAAFEKGAIDAWVIWEPFLAAAEAATGARQLTDGTGLVNNHEYYLASREFVESDPAAVDAILASLGEVDTWINENKDEVAERFAPELGMPADILSVAVDRVSYGVQPITPGRGRRAAEDRRRLLRARTDPDRDRDRGRHQGGQLVSVATADHVPRQRLLVHPDAWRRPLSRHRRRRAGDRPRLPEPDRAGRRPARLLRRAAADRKELRGRLDRRLDAGAADRAAALPGRGAARAAAADARRAHDGDSRPACRAGGC